MARALRLAKFWRMMAARLDSATMQGFTKAPGRVFVAHLAAEGLPKGATQDGQWGRVIISPAAASFPMTRSNRILRPVQFRLVTEENDFAPPTPEEGWTFDPLIPLEGMQEEAKLLLDGWQPEVAQGYMRVGFRVWLEEFWQPAPKWDDVNKVHWLSSLYSFQAADVAV
jgi:hypothetical protein